jgi:hypothetical protein
MSHWCHFIIEAYCLFNILKMSGAKPTQMYRWDETKKEFVPTGDKVICPPKSERVLDSKAFCKAPGRPKADKCFKNSAMCPFFGYTSVPKKEYDAMVRAWENVIAE